MSDNFIFPDDPDGFAFQDSAGGDAPDDASHDASPSGTFSDDSFSADGFAGGFVDDDFTGGFVGGFEDPAPVEPPFGETPPGDDEAPALPAFGSIDDGVFIGGGAFEAPPLDLSDVVGDVPVGDGSDGGGVAVSFSEAEAPVSEAPVGRDRAKKAPKRARSKDGLILGIHVTPKHVYGVLVRPSPDGYEPLRQFVRNRAESQYGQTALSPDDVELEEATLAVGADDPSVQFGGSGEIDFSAEFAGMGVVTDAAFDATAIGGDVDAQAQPIIFELRDILEECAQSGFARPALAFVVDEPDVAYAEISVPPEKKDKKAKRTKKGKEGPPPASDGLKGTASTPVKRDRLVELLPDFGVSVDTSRVAFVPMSPRDGLRRYLAVAPTPSEPVSESIGMLREQAAHRKTVVKTLEAEVPLLIGLVRLTLAPEPHENTAVVRVGAEDTVVLLLAGNELHHYEMMQSVTAFDGPDTICSRVLLQQDVQGVGTVHSVVVVSEEREKELVQGFAAFYPEARVETLREGLARQGLVGPYGPLAPMLVGAAGAAVAGHRLRQKDGPFEHANLLPAALLKRKRSLDLSFGWHTLVVAMLLFLSVLYFSYLYVSQEGEIAQAEQTLAEFPPEALLSAPQLQTRIDSLRMRQATLAAALGALDSLLIDTDRWTQTLLRTTRAASQTGGIWIEQWTPSGADVELEGFATTRANVVGLGQRLSATIEEVTFEQVREYPVYKYRLRFTQPPELPQVTRVLREQAGDVAPDAPPAPLDGMDGAP
ncbi:hypothetical protein [Rubrivirga sp.]|uniref:hypothetical protein n=1 Tax=Rubrivirga sp. TaxID=1885344 RepID=UPI003B519B14